MCIRDRQYKMSNPNKVFFIGLKNYSAALNNAEFRSSIWVTLQYIFYALAIETPLELFRCV